MAGPWQRALVLAQRDPRFVDLTDSRFHQNGMLPDATLFQSAFMRWLSVRSYEPDSRGAIGAREALTAFYAGEGWSLPADRFFLTAGTSEAYALLFSTLAEAGDAVALPRPGYPLFEHIAQHSRLETVFYDQPYHSEWQPDAVSLEACLTPRTKFLVVISPNNPTGQIVTQATLESLADVARRHDLMVIVDEVFDACVEGDRLPRLGAIAPDVKVFTLNGISKRFGSPDLKLAWTAVSGPTRWVRKTAEALELANDTFLSANSYSQFLLPDLFQSMGAWQGDLRALLAKNRAEVKGWMANEPRVSGILPRGGIHGLWRLEGLPVEHDEAAAVALMKAEQVALHPGYFYDVQEPGVWLVYSLIKEPVAFRDALARVARWVSSLEPGRSARR